MGSRGGGFAALIKIHHAAVDGISGLELMTVLHDREPDAVPPAVEDHWRPEVAPSPWKLLSGAALYDLAKPMHAVRVTGRVAPTLVRVPLDIRRGSLQAPPSSLRSIRFNSFRSDRIARSAALLLHSTTVATWPAQSPARRSTTPC